MVSKKKKKKCKLGIAPRVVSFCLCKVRLDSFKLMIISQSLLNQCCKNSQSEWLPNRRPRVGAYGITHKANVGTSQKR